MLYYLSIILLSYLYIYLVSVLGFGNWLNSNKKEDYEITRDAMKLCYEAG